MKNPNTTNADRKKEPGLLHEKGLWATLLVALLAAVHWFGAVCYSRGYDYFLWIYNAWVATGSIGTGSWPNWSSFSAAGHPFFKMAGLTDALILACFIGPLGVDLGTQVYAILLYGISAVGVYALARHLGAGQAGAVVGACAYVFSWFLTYTSYYQTYLSNFLSYAMMPWGALALAIAIRTASRAHLLAAALMLFISITSNAQVSIRFLLFVVPLAWIDAVVCGGANVRRALAYCAGFVGIAFCWASFLIVPALILRGEVLLLGELRSNWFMPPWAMLTWLPLSGLHMLSQQLLGSGFLGREIIYWAIHSDYLGLSVVAIVCSGVLMHRCELRVRWLLALLALYFLLYFLVVPNVPASAWVGRTHNWAILPTLILALLCPYGCDYVAQRWPWIGSQRRAALVLCAFIVLDLGSASYFLNRLGITHTPLEELPEVGVWHKVWAEEGPSGQGRWFTFNPDHTHYLYPVLTGRETANIIELRSRNWEYDSFVRHQRESMRSLDLSYQPSESLALLNCRFVDLPVRLFDYRGDAKRFAQGVALLQRDSRLVEVLRREWEPLDGGYDASRGQLRIADRINSRSRVGDIAQVVWRNESAHWAFVPEKTVLLVGDSRSAQHYFERITHLSEFRAAGLLFILYSVKGVPDPRIVEAADAQVVVEDGVPIASLPEWDIEDITDFYVSLSPPVGRPRRLVQTNEEIVVQMPAMERSSFLFLSQQRFSDWKAYDELGQLLPVFKAAAGLTAIYAPAKILTITYRYEMPQTEWLARIFSLFSFVCTLVWCRWRRT